MTKPAQFFIASILAGFTLVCLSASAAAQVQNSWSGFYLSANDAGLKMEISLALLALGAAAYCYFRNNTKWGLESVRAQVFLSGVHSGNTVSDANYAARFGIIGQLPPEVIQSANALSKAEYGGRTFPVIAEAYQRGMKPRLPVWQKIIILGFTQSPQKDIPSQVKAVAR
jgi:hypothetical protein